MGCNRKIRGLARDDLPMLQHHLEVAQGVLGAVGS
jgi:hypothetical protein